MGAEPASRQPVPLRRNRDFQLLWGGQAVSLLGSQTSKIAYPLLVLAMTGSPAKAGIAGFAAMLGYLLFPLPAGALADRHDRKRIMIGCAAERGATGRPGAGRHAVRAVPGRAVRRGRAVLPGFAGHAAVHQGADAGRCASCVFSCGLAAAAG